MGLFTKKQDIPDIAPAQKQTVLPELPEETIEFEESSLQEIPSLPALPSLPTNNFNDSLNNEIVKSAVYDQEDNSSEEDIEELPKDFSFEKSEEKSKAKIPFPPEEKKEKKTLEISTNYEEHSTKSSEPIFVRIDKFHAAQEDFNEIKKKLKEIESALRKVKDIKIKEDEEVSQWTENIEKIKSRLDEIDSNIFSKI